MGMFTEIFVNVDLKEETPCKFISELRKICKNGYLFRNNSYYTPSTWCANLTYDIISKQWSLLGKGDIMNYENQIQDFFKWIMPHVKGKEGDFIGYYRYEEEQLPTLVTLKKGDKK